MRRAPIGLLLCTLFPILVPAEESDLSRPTLVTLKLDNAAPKQVFDELAKHVGTQFPTLPKQMWERTPGAPISVSFDHQPFWLAMRDTCAKAGISLKHATDTPEPRVILTRDNQNWTDFPAVSSGPFLVTLIGLHRSSTVDMRKPADVKRDFYAKFTVFCEPRIRLLRASLQARVEQAADDKGNTLIPKNIPEDQAQAMNFVTSWVYNLEGKLDYPIENAGTKIPILRCSARFVAQTASETLTLTDPLSAKGVAKTVAGRTITLKDLRRTPDEWEAVVTLSRGQLSPDQWAAALFPGNSLRLHDGAGNTLTARGFGLGSKGDEATYIFKFEREPLRGTRLAKPTKLTWEIPTATKELPLTFEFKDVTVP